jgi:hypothetical protein
MGGDKAGKHILGKKKVALKLPVYHGHAAFEFPRVGLRIEKYIHDSAEDRKHQDKKNPGELVRRFFPLVEYIKAYHNADDTEAPVYILKRHTGTRDKTYRKEDLDKQQDNNKYPSPEYYPDPFSAYFERV